MIYSKKNTLIVGWNKITETFLENRIHNPEDQIIVDLESQYLRKQKLTYQTNNHSIYMVSEKYVDSCHRYGKNCRSKTKCIDYISTRKLKQAIELIFCK